ncbi:hypothetical protein AYR56_09910 [Loigolactobacillus backii]|uniref:Glycosyltransferase 2-like domain-containing protein n=1 Tax=Loigolactobacillus backii TaxID=375175 RepID=A0A192H2P6_9LACO|nr:MULTISPECIES: glycosyltransferase family 2 protein [Loigolactobacillus]ANK62553.1 hypothetical protein AYR53_07090 [Loigolactobacillus backii]ANK70436.1 hypothetical protein AYR56_09910 [Loigolactobacillus backii]
MNFVSIVVTHNRKELLVEAVNSLINQTVKPGKIIIIDNNSTDGTQDHLSDENILQNPLVKYYFVKDNLGGAGGFYFGMKKAIETEKFDWITLSDDDAIYSNDYFEHISDAIKSAPNIKAFCGSIYLEDGRIQYTHRRRIASTKRIKEVTIPVKEYSHNFYVDVFTFVGCVISRELISKIGLPDKDYFIWYDDVEYSLRIREYTKILNVSKAKIVHKTKVISNDFAAQYKPDWREYYGVRNRLLTIKRHTSSQLFIFFYIPYYILRSYLDLFRPRFKGFRRHVVYVYTCAYFDALRNKKGKNPKFLPD